MNKRKKGKEYEDIAADHLKKCGYTILERNFTFSRYGEIDIIARGRDRTIVFAEIKYRSGNRSGSPLEAVDIKKQRQISKVALYYLMRRGYGADAPCRFDVIGIDGEGHIDHVENAFEYAGRK